MWSYRDAIRAAIGDEMRADESVVLLGEDVAEAGGVFKVTEGLLEEFGGTRVRDTPISEQAIVGSAIGAAMLGFRPIVEIMFADFAATCFDQIANQLAKHAYLTGYQGDLPVTIRLASGAGNGFGAQHSQAVENWFLSHAGLTICAPTSAADAYSLVRQSIRAPGPVLVFEHKGLYAERETRIVEADRRMLGSGKVVRVGSDITIVGIQVALLRALEAAEELAASEVHAEVIDPGSLRPLDLGIILTSVSKTGRLLCVQEGERMGSWGQDVVASVAEQGFSALDARPMLLSSPPNPVPYAKAREDAWMPNRAQIVKVALELVRW